METSSDKDMGIKICTHTYMYIYISSDKDWV